MIILNLCVNVNARKKKKKGKEEEEVPAETIYFDPSRQQVLDVLLRPFQLLVQTVSSIQILEKDLVPLVDIPDRRVLELNEQDEDVAEAKRKVTAYVEEGFRGP